MRAPLLVSLALLAGCVGGPPDPSSEAVVAACSRPEGGGRECPYPDLTAACADLSVEGRPEDGTFLIAARLQNRCDHAVWHQGTHMGDAEREGLAAWVEVEGVRYHFTGGSAWETPLVAPAFPQGRVLAPAEEVEATWDWNGTLAQPQGEPCHCTEFRRPPPGEHALGAVVARVPEATATGTIAIG